MALNTPTTPVAVQPNPLGDSSDVDRVGCVVRLTIRLEDFSNDDGPQAQSETQPAHTPGGRAQTALADQQALQAVRRASSEFDLLADAQVKLAAVGVGGALSGADPNGGAAAPNDTAADDFTVVLSVVPTDISLVLNGFRTADQARFSIPIDALPVAPDLVRSMFVEVFVDEVAVDDFTDPVRWLPKIYQSPPLFRGYAADEELDTDESTLMISVNADSLEKRLMDLKINPFTKARRIARGGDTITSYVQRLISTIPEFNGKLGNPIGVRMFPNVAEDQVPKLDATLFKKSLQSAQSRVQAGGPVQGAPPPGTDPAQDPANGTPAGVGMPPSPTVCDVSVWDVVWRACVLCGVMPVYDPSVVATLPDGSTYPLGANNILLIPPQNIMETPDGGITIPGGPVDGFKRDLLVGSAGTTKIHSEVRFFIWGHNIKSQKMKRKYGRTEKVPRVRCIAHNPDAPAGKRTLTSIYPTTKRGTAISARGSGKSGKGHTPIEEEVVRIFHDIRSQAALDAIAVATYASIGRREITVTIETDSMSSYFNPQLKQRTMDILRLRPGTPCRVTVADTVDGGNGTLLANALSDLYSKRANPAFIEKAILKGPTSSAVVATQGWSSLQAACRKIEAAYQSAQLTDWFYTRCVELHGNQDQGWTATIELMNYVEARNLPANLSPQDAARNNAVKAVVPGRAPDLTDQVIADRTDAVIRQKQGIA